MIQIYIKIFQVKPYISNNFDSYNPFQWKRVTPSEMVKIVSKSKGSKSKDVYGLSNNVVKSIIHQIYFQLCGNQYMFPIRAFPWCLKIF
jgi:hypothetical protein